MDPANRVIWSAILLRYLPPLFPRTPTCRGREHGVSVGVVLFTRDLRLRDNPVCGTPYIPTRPSGANGGRCLGQPSLRTRGKR